MTLLPTCWRKNWREIQNLSDVLFGNARLLQDFCLQQHIVEKHGLGYILLINRLIHQLKASLMWSLLHNPSAHSSAWMLTSASCFRRRFMFDLQTRRVNRSAISSEAFALFPLEIHWIQSWNHPSLWNSKLRYPPPPLLCLWNSSPRNPPLPLHSNMPLVVWYRHFLESPNGK